MVDNCLLCESVKLGRDVNSPIRMGAGLVKNLTLCESIKLGRGHGRTNTDGGWFGRKLTLCESIELGRDVGSAIRMGAGVVDNSEFEKALSWGDVASPIGTGAGLKVWNARRSSCAENYAN